MIATLETPVAAADRSAGAPASSSSARPASAGGGVSLPAVGGTPLVAIDGIFAKLECVNPCGSIKDRVGRYVLEESMRRGLLVPGTRIIEATSGNTGIAIAYFGRELGFPVTVVMPEDMTEERKQIIRSLGADLLLCSAVGSFSEAAAIRDRLAAEHGWFNFDQFANPLDAECHELTTGEEIASALSRVDAFVAGVGTGGTVVGVGRRLRRDNPNLWIAVVEPSESAVMSGGPAGRHGIPGIGDGFIPALASDGAGGVHPLVDEVIQVSTEEATAAARELARRHGYCVGLSSGANYVAAMRLAARRHEEHRLLARFQNVVTVFPDGFTKYASRGLERCAPGRCPYEHDLAV